MPECHSGGIEEECSAFRQLTDENRTQRLAMYGEDRTGEGGR